MSLLRLLSELKCPLYSFTEHCHPKPELLIIYGLVKSQLWRHSLVLLLTAKPWVVGILWSILYQQNRAVVHQVRIHVICGNIMQRKHLCRLAECHSYSRIQARATYQPIDGIGFKKNEKFVWEASTLFISVIMKLTYTNTFSIHVWVLHLYRIMITYEQIKKNYGVRAFY